jgi:hypothetical protein
MRFTGILIATAISLGARAPCSSSSGAPSPPAEGGGTTDDTDAGDTDGDIVSCATDPLAQTYTANMQKTGSLFTFDLVSSTPAPPVKGYVTLVVKLADLMGNPVPNASVTYVVPYMPRHGHGSPLTPTVTANADGTFTVDSVFLFMPGLWEFKIHAAVGGEATDCSKDPAMCDEVDYYFCVNG